jgi:hypothetical protein
VRLSLTSRAFPGRCSFYLRCAYGLLGVNTCIFLYLAVWVTMIRKRDDWEAAAPWAIPSATVCAIVMCFMCVRPPTPQCIPSPERCIGPYTIGSA